jgi:tRNA(Glu) U13 pseudouridine synthase TruD
MILKPDVIDSKIVKFKGKEDDILIPENASNSEWVIDSKEGEHQAFCVRFKLASSSYATMFVRELMHTTS